MSVCAHVLMCVCSSMDGLLSSMFSHVLLICACSSTGKCEHADVFVCADVCVQMSVHARCVAVHADVYCCVFFCADVSGALCGSLCCVLVCVFVCARCAAVHAVSVYRCVCAAVHTDTRRDVCGALQTLTRADACVRTVHTWTCAHRHMCGCV